MELISWTLLLGAVWTVLYAKLVREESHQIELLDKQRIPYDGEAICKK